MPLAARPTGARAAGRAIVFTDVAPRSRFDYRTNNDFTGRKYFPQPMCGGVAIFDYDGDGRPDIFFTNGAKLPELRKTDRSFYNCLLRNKGDGTFEDVTAKARLEGAQLDFSFGVAAGDYDNDGRVDLFLCQAGRNALFHNNGDGTFSDVTQQAGLATKPKDLLSVCAAWVDYDGDGLVDLVVSQYTYWSPASDIRCSVPEAGEIYCTPKRYRSVSHTLYHNLGGGRFEDVSGPAGFAAAANGKGMGIAIADVNGDGRMDVFVANDTEPNFLFVNQGNGRFAEQAATWGIDYNDRAETVSGMGADAKDYDNDGRVDVFYNNLQQQIWGLFRNDAGRTFQYASPAAGLLSLSRRFSGWSNGFVDYDDDGWKDIYSANGDVDYLPENGEQRDTHAAQPGRTALRGRLRAARAGLRAEGLPARLGLRRPQRRRLPRHRGHLARPAATDPAERRGQRQPLAAGRRARPPQQPGRHRREAQADDRLRPPALQPRHDQRRLHVLERPPRALRPRHGDGDPRARDPLAERHRAAPRRRRGGPRARRRGAAVSGGGSRCRATPSARRMRGVMNASRLSAVVGLLLALAAALAGSGRIQAQAPPPPASSAAGQRAPVALSPEEDAKVAQIVKQQCSKCHVRAAAAVPAARHVALAHPGDGRSAA